MSKKYVIMKSCRVYKGGPGYAGISCEAAEVEPGKIYTDKKEALEDARKLSLANPVGFVVEPYIEIDKAA